MDRALMTADDARAELTRLRGTMLWAWAHGHSCTIGDSPEFRDVRRRDAELCAIIGEHGEV